jgi:glycosyltransferase involved in cell wall biosynthesis
MNEKPVISIVIPAYNEEKMISKCLRSMVDQNFPLPYEIIVVDNNSTDSTSEIIKNDFPTVRLIQEETQGVGAAREAGFKAARAEWIASMDADGYAPPDWLSKIWDEKEDCDDPIAIGGYVEFYDMTLSSYFTKLTRKAHVLSISNYIYRKKKPMSTQNMIIKKDAWKKCGGFNTEIVSPLGLDDVEFATRLSDYGNTYVSSKVVTYCSGRRYKHDLVRTIYHRNRAYWSYFRGNVYDPKERRDVR